MVDVDLHKTQTLMGKEKVHFTFRKGVKERLGLAVPLCVLHTVHRQIGIETKRATELWTGDGGLKKGDRTRRGCACVLVFPEKDERKETQKNQTRRAWFLARESERKGEQKD